MHPCFQIPNAHSEYDFGFFKLAMENCQKNGKIKFRANGNRTIEKTALNKDHIRKMSKSIFDHEHCYRGPRNYFGGSTEFSKIRKY